MDTSDKTFQELRDKIKAVCNKYNFELLEANCYHCNEIVIEIETYDGLDDFVIHGYLDYNMRFNYEFNVVDSNEHYFSVDFYKMLGEIGEMIESNPE